MKMYKLGQLSDAWKTAAGMVVPWIWPQVLKN